MSKHLKDIQWFRLCVAIILPFLAGGIGSLFTAPSIPTWYASLAKPWFNPPNWIFGPVWTSLYLLMGVALYLVWISKNTEKKKKGLLFFISQIIFNTLWSVVFFGFKSPEAALVVIIFLWIMILLTIINFLKVSKRAGVLLIPYILWVSFATLLNIFIVILN